MNANVAIQQIRKIFKDNLYKREILTKTGGKIDFNRLSQHKTSKYIRRKPLERGSQKYNIEILLDDSGSMYGHGEGKRALLAHEATARLAKVLGPVADINVTLFNYLEQSTNWRSFTSTSHLKRTGSSIYDVGEMELPNFFVTRNSDNLNVVSAFPPADMDEVEFSEPATGGNYEIVNILNAVSRLKSKEGKKIIIVLSDGQPNLDYHPSWDEDKSAGFKKLILAGRRVKKYPVDDYRKIIEDIKTRHGIETISFGLETDDMSHLYPNFTPIYCLDDLYEGLIKELKRVI